MGSGSSSQKLSATTTWEKPPYWVATCVVPMDASTQGDCFGTVSSGCQMTAANQVVRQRSGKFDSDAAMWSRPLLTGKHVFEINFPKAGRGTHGCIGLGLADADITTKGKCCIVGNDNSSWGVNLTSRRAEHGKKSGGQDNLKHSKMTAYGAQSKAFNQDKGHIIKTYPQNQAYLPDVFLMYVDADSGTLMFGSENHGYFGTAWDELPRDQPLFVMVGMVDQGASCTITYRGQAQIGGPPPAAPPAQVYYAAPAEAPPVYADKAEAPPPAANPAPVYPTPAVETQVYAKPAEEKPAEEKPAESTPAAETPAESTPAVETPAESTPVVETPAESTPADETPADETPAESTPVVETPAESTPAVETPAESTAAESTPVVETPAETTPASETPAETTPAAETPAETTPATETTAK